MSKYEALVNKGEESAGRNPEGYRRKVLLLSLLGYAFIGGLLLLAIVLGWWTLVAVIKFRTYRFLALKLIVPLGLLVWILIKSLKVEAPEPEGMEVTEKDAPALFWTINAIQQKVGAPPIDIVLINKEFGASIVQLPRKGLFFITRNYLIIGLPLMLALGKEQLQPVLAHEIGRMSKEHGASGYWIYRLQRTWEQILKALSGSKNLATMPFHMFFSWYVPYFSAYSSVFARQREFEADASAVKLAGKKLFAEALTVSHVAADMHERFWQKLRSTAETSEDIPAPYALMRDEFLKPRDPAATTKAITLAMRTCTSSSDTHPSLRERLNEAGLKPVTPPDLAASAADALMGKDQTQYYIGELDSKWHDTNRESWPEAGEGLRGQRMRIKELEQVHARGATLPHPLVLELANLYDSMNEKEKALPLYVRLHQEEPDNPLIAYQCGRLMLDKGDPAGVECMKKAIKADMRIKGPALEAIHFHLLSSGREAEAEKCFGAIVNHYKMMVSAQKEAQSISLKDTFSTPKLKPDAIKAMKKAFGAYEDVVHVYVTEKAVKHEVYRPFHVVSIELKYQLIRYHEQDFDLQSRIAHEVDIPIKYIITLHNYLGAKLGKQIKGSSIMLY